MTQVRLHGILAKEFGEFFSFKLGKAKDVIRAIDANKKNFIKRINDLAKEGFNYTLIVDGKKVSDFSEIEIKKEHKSIEIVPMIVGSGPFIALVVPLLAPALGGGIMGNLILGVISIGLQMLLAPKPDAGPPISATTKAFDESFKFSNKANVAAQGTPVPVGYGRLKVGSQVVQFSIKSFPQNEESTEVMTRNPFNFVGGEDDVANTISNRL